MLLPQKTSFYLILVFLLLSGCLILQLQLSFLHLYQQFASEIAPCCLLERMRRMTARCWKRVAWELGGTEGPGPFDPHSHPDLGFLKPQKFTLTHYLKHSRSKCQVMSESDLQYEICD